MIKQSRRWITVGALGVMIASTLGSLAVTPAQAHSQGHSKSTWYSRSVRSTTRQSGWTKGRHVGWSKKGQHLGTTRSRRRTVHRGHRHRHRHRFYWHTHYHRSGHHR